MLIAAQALIPALVARVSADGREVVPFADTETLRALEAITLRRPLTVALERGFAATARGAALINRIKADPSLSRSEIRVIAQDHLESVASGTSAEAAEAPAATHDSGTRRVVRHVLAGGVEATIDGNPAMLVDLSTLGAQVVSAGVLKPNQRIRLAVSDGKTTVRTTGTIVWARFEIPPGSGPRYRAGIEFVAPDTVAIDGFCRMHRG